MVTTTSAPVMAAAAVGLVATSPNAPRARALAARRAPDPRRGREAGGRNPAAPPPASPRGSPPGRPLRPRPPRPAAHDPSAPTGDGHATHGGGAHGRDAAGVEDGPELTRGGVTEQQRGVDGRDRQQPVPRESGHPLDAQQVPGGARTRTAQPRRHRMRERGVGARVDPDLGGQVGIADEGPKGLLGEPELLGDLGHHRGDIRRGQVSEGCTLGHFRRVAGHATLDVSDGGRAVTVRESCEAFPSRRRRATVEGRVHGVRSSRGDARGTDGKDDA